MDAPGLLLTVASCAMLWLAIGLAGLFRARDFALISRRLFPASAAVSLIVAFFALIAISSGQEELILPIGLPNLPFHLRLDALSAFFIFLLGAASAGISIYAAGYFREAEGEALGLQCLLYHVFLASMAGVMLANDGYAFMVAWETMALSSFFLVTTEHRHAEIRRAGYL
ncbi:MAG: hydrogenase 4 subunit B, partial [Candidatus Accumulibacter sp.]|nr:hydrogenase 4 subunit B [Accumulibacter sp.]